MAATTATEETGEFCVAVATATRTAVCWPSWLKALTVILSRPSSQSGSYTGLIGFNHRWLKALKGDELPRNGPSVYAKSSCIVKICTRKYFSGLYFCTCPLAILAKLLHCTLAAAQCIVISPVCLWVCLCVCVGESITTITPNCDNSKLSASTLTKLGL